MWYVILSLFAVGFAVAICWRALGHDFAEFMIVSFMTIAGLSLFLFILALPALGFTTGLMLDYSSGERQGYVTKFSQKGIIYKTFEGQIQVGTGQMAALQEPWQFSVPPDMAEDVNNLLGERVRIEYNEALVLPFRLGGSSYLITKIEKIDD